MTQVEEVKAQAPAPVHVMRGRECRVCFGPHDEEIHQASTSIKEWFKAEVTRYLPPTE
jgi:hypothetical protein